MGVSPTLIWNRGDEMNSESPKTDIQPPVVSKEPQPVPRPDASRYPSLDLARVTTRPISTRRNLVSIHDFATPFDPGSAPRAFFQGLPETRHRTNAAESLADVVETIVVARGKGRGITWCCGPHLVKYGLSLHLIDLMERGFVSAIATTGAGAIHDAEIALFGATSEEMTGEIGTGRFGMARETGEFINRTAIEARDRRIGFGEALGSKLTSAGAPHLKYSLLGNAYRIGIPMTVHVAIGTDIVHAQPGFDGGATGCASQFDFQIFGAALDRIDNGGVHLNVASSVVLPEIFLKCLTVANNLRRGEGKASVTDFLTVAIDHQSAYRPLMNVVRRPTIDVGRGIELLGRIELLLPLLSGLLVARDSAASAVSGDALPG